VTVKEQLEAMAREAGIEPVDQIWTWTVPALAMAVANARVANMDRDRERVTPISEGRNG
jgi:hypothetical protein